MNINNWSDLFINEYGTPHDYIFFLAFLVVALPFFTLVFYIYKKKNISLVKKEGCFFYFLLPIAYYIYFTILFFAFININNELEFIAIVAGGAVLWLMPLMPIIFIIGIILFFKYWKKYFFSKKR